MGCGCQDKTEPALKTGHAMPPCEGPQSWMHGIQYTSVPNVSRFAYISGPMRGLPLFNFAAFYRAESLLLEAGWNTINPARMDDACKGGTELGTDAYVERDLEAIRALNVITDAVVTLEGARGELVVKYPRALGKGSQAEIAVAEWRGVPVMPVAQALMYRVGRASDAEAQAPQKGSGIVSLPLPVLRDQNPPLGEDVISDARRFYAGQRAAEYMKVLDLKAEGLGAALTKAENAIFRGDAGADVFEDKRTQSAQSEEVRVTDPVTGGQKGRKPIRFDLIPQRFAGNVTARRSGSDQTTTTQLRTKLEWFWRTAGKGPVDESWGRSALMDAARLCEDALGGPVAGRYYVARVYGIGALKYSDDNWRQGYAWSLSYAAAMRHLDKIERGEMMDAETGVPHYANVWWHCATLYTFATESLGTDDRPKGVK